MRWAMCSAISQCLASTPRQSPATLAGWFGIRISRIGLFSTANLRTPAFFYGAIVIVAATALHRAGGKKSAAATLLHVNRERMKYLCRKYRVGGAGGDVPNSE